MKGFTRSNQLLSLCGLNCSLCPMHLGNHCNGCGNGNQSCKIAKCSMEHDNIEYCFECKSYPCDKYRNIDEYDSFISHYNQKKDLKKAKSIGFDAYSKEQLEKSKILEYLLSEYNDGRKKTFYCVAVNLIEFYELKEMLMKISLDTDFLLLDDNDRCKYVYELFISKSKEMGIDFKLRKK